MSCLTSNFGEKVKTVQGGWKYSDNVGNIRTVLETFGQLFIPEILLEILGQIFIAENFLSRLYFPAFCTLDCFQCCQKPF